MSEKAKQKVIDPLELAEIWSSKMKVKHGVPRPMEEVRQIAYRAIMARRKKFFSYMTDVVLCGDSETIYALAEKHKCEPIGIKNYYQLGLGSMDVITRAQSDAILYWLYIKGATLGMEELQAKKVKSAEQRLAELGFASFAEEHNQ